MHLYDELLKINCFAKENLHVRNNYEAVELPFSRAQRIEYDFQQKATMDQVPGMMSSMSTTNYCKGICIV